jgi:Predicted ATP-dependent carboligase related to biotin carboxylase
MGTARENCIDAIARHLKGRDLIWFGVRGKDANPLHCFEEFNTCFSIIAPSTVPGVKNHCLESLTGLRVNVDRYDIDMDASPAASEMKNALCASMNKPCVLVPYRPLSVIDAAYFPRASTATYLGLFRDFQRPFDHKIWVESQLRRNGVQTIPWSYLSTRNNPREKLAFALGHGPLVLRLNNSSGGAGLRIVHNADELDQHLAWICEDAEEYFAYAPYLHPSIPLSISACAFPNGQTTVHPFSVQIIGDPELSPYPLGFCGSDFGAVRNLSGAEVEELESMTRQIGKWLASSGFIGAFGIDALLYQGKLYLTEVNPRFLGSSLLSAEIDQAEGLPDIFLSHMAAFLGHPAPKRPTLRSTYAGQRPCIQRIRHNLDPDPILATPTEDTIPNGAHVLQPAAPGTRIEHGGMLWKELTYALEI